ncbi:ABC transporter permease [Dactylosporangium aurantiacum]|uniref:ABC transporter permease n=1 Tax=Dactylosporangium aurantiacum TaxID=35754 RepID=A0A9Q9MIW7_9ACTN|nr:ABC transporter permease [Dactylosporangium aurantiacum]MDG6110091.1 ABC transporter permease [Dactylosporangium aurantiacum]UWZ51342.1 ABC transporter permease [Dactylosporangium aurantiacum]
MTLGTRPPDAAVVGAPPPRRRPGGPRLALRLIRTGPVFMLLVIVAAASVLSPVFLTTRNLGNVLAQTAVIAVLAVAQLLVIVTRGIDLSVGSTVALAAVAGALVFEAVPSATVVVLTMLGTGLAVGAVNGVALVWGRLPHPFIVTLATLSVAHGLALWLAGGQPHRGMPGIIQVLGGESIGWLPYSTLLVAALALLVLLLTTRLVWGRWIYAVGGNPDAARRAAIPVNAVLVSVYVMSGLAAGIAACITAGRLNAGSPTFGELAELDAIAAVVIGGASFLGGRGTVTNALVGALMIGVIRNAMNLLNVDAFIQPIVIGVVILIAVELDVIRGALERRFQVMQAVAA